MKTICILISLNHLIMFVYLLPLCYSLYFSINSFFSFWITLLFSSPAIHLLFLCYFFLYSDLNFFKSFNDIDSLFEHKSVQRLDRRSTRHSLIFNLYVIEKHYLIRTEKNLWQFFINWLKTLIKLLFLAKLELITNVNFLMRLPLCD